ncbi:MAG TPA: acetate kinase [Micromonosporaceae bacterium]|nr:acetate kinase [Micromonosporaceae bacterium]
MERPDLILVLNSGSSSLKYQLLDLSDPAARRGGLVERIGEPGAVPDHRAAVARVLDELPDPDAVTAVGHRVVHGGSLTAPTLIDDDVIAIIEESAPLAPLHNPPNLAGILAARDALPGVPQVAVFDTAFHADLPAAVATYAIDRAVTQRLRIRRYGFHGTSHRYVAKQTAALLGRELTDLNTIVLHLGNGASATAVAGGRSVETSMGLSPLEGLVMGTRCGDIDPGVLLYLQRSGGFTLDELDDLLEHHSGLLGLCGDRDMRDVLRRRAAGDPDAALAFDIYCHRVRKYVGAYHAVLGRLDAIAFTAGIGENSAQVRAACLAGLQMWGIQIDPERNGTGDSARVISPDGAPVAVCVIPTDEEWEIAAEVADLLAAR